MTTHLRLLLSLTAALGLWLGAAGSALADEFAELVQVFAERDFDSTEQAIRDLAELDDERVLPLLDKVLAGDVRMRKSDDRVVVLREEGGDDYISDAVTGEELGEISTRKLNRMKMNNNLRGLLGELIAALKLGSPDPAIRLAAAQELIKDASPESSVLLRDALAGESDPEVIAAIEVGVATLDARSDDPAVRMAAVEAMQGSLHPEVRGLLAAVGLAITFGVMGVINMAHGEMVMIGAYTTYVVQQLMPGFIDWSLLVAVPAAFLMAAIVGVIIERGIIQHLYGRPLETLLATFGVSLVLQQAVRTIFSPLNRQVITPSWMSGSVEINPALAVTWNRVYIIVFSLLVLVGLMLLLSRSRFGLQVRAVMQDRNTARALGIRSTRIDMMTFALGSGIAGVGGVALSQLTNVGPNMGQGYIIDSFMVVVFGGVGNLLGTLFGAMTLGVANKFLEPVTGAVLAKIIVLVAIILFIQRRPRGMFALRGRAAEE